MAVAAQEIDQPKHVRIAFRADDDRTGAGLDQADAAQDQRAHDALAKIGLGDQQRAQPLGRNGHRLDVGQRGRVDEVRPARSCASSPMKLPRSWVTMWDALAAVVLR